MHSAFIEHLQCANTIADIHGVPWIPKRFLLLNLATTLVDIIVPFCR